MIDATVARKKSSSFDLVFKEIEHTIHEAEGSLERFQENRESGEDLQNCIDCLNQLRGRSEEHTSELQSRPHLVCRLLLEKKNNRRAMQALRYESHSDCSM